MSHRKRAPFNQASFAEQVQLAAPTARTLLLSGFDTLSTGDAGETELTAAVSRVLGTDVCDCATDEGLTRLEEGLFAALALGVAVGTLLRPETFKDGSR